jgi:transcriptional regulator with XRE-family HTH domain
MSLDFFASMRTVQSRVGARIRRLRERKGWLQRGLANIADLPLRTIGRIERGEVDVRISTLAKIARALRVSLRELMR